VATLRFARAGAALAAAVLALAVAVPAAGGARRPAAATGVTVTQAIAGLNQTDGGGLTPPDVQVAAGSGFVVEMVNLAAEVWQTSGGQPVPVSTRPLGALFQSGTNALTDPRVLYDAVSGRWFASVSDLDASAVLLAVSDTNDPSGSWHVSTFAADGRCADQPRLGTADGVVVLAADVFTECLNRFSRNVGGELWIVSKADLLEGVDSPAFTTFGPGTFSSLTPVHSLSPTATEYVVSVDAPASTVVHLLEVNGIPPAPVDVHEVATPSISLLLTPPTAVEPTAGGGSTADVATNDDRILDAVWEQGKLWFSANTSCIPQGDTERRACARLAELSTADRALAWETDLGFAGAHVFFPAIRPDASGNLVVAFGRSSPTLAPEVAVTARSPDGTIAPPSVVGQSGAPARSEHGAERWGDYFGAARDPVHPEVVWVAGEIVPADTGSNDWTTVVGSTVVTEGPAPPSVRVAVPPRLRALAASGIAGRPLRLRFVALADGSGIRRQVTVRAGTKVVFRKTTRPGPLHTLLLYSVPWRPSKRLVGRFSFCVRSLVGDGTASPQTCAAVRLRAR
jgi:hypothetical protein